MSSNAPQTALAWARVIAAGSLLFVQSDRSDGPGDESASRDRSLAMEEQTAEVGEPNATLNSEPPHDHRPSLRCDELEGRSARRRAPAARCSRALVWHHEAMGEDVEVAVYALYRAILAGWNADDADGFAAPFAEDGEVVGFDGSQIAGRAQIAEQMAGIFADRATGTYVGIVRDVRRLGDDAALLRAVSGVVPAGEDDLKPELNAIQSLVARRHDEGWQVVLYHNTPAQFHGRPELAKALTEELRGEHTTDPT